MLFGVYEFEIVQEDDGWYVAAPYDLEGATQGENFADLCEMMADWLKVVIEDHEMRGVPMPKPTYGNVPRYGGTNMIVAVQAGRETVEKVTATEAAERLGVSRSRVSQMLSSHLLDGWRDGRNTYITMDSLRSRIEDRLLDWSQSRPLEEGMRKRDDKEAVRPAASETAAALDESAKQKTVTPDGCTLGLSTAGAMMA